MLCRSPLASNRNRHEHVATRGHTVPRPPQWVIMAAMEQSSGSIDAPEMGTSAVNADGKVLVFVADDDWMPFEEFIVSGDVISLLSDGSAYSRSYGSLALDTVRRTGRLVALGVDATGKPTAALELEARCGR